MRLNLESLHADGSTRPASGVLAAYQPPSGPGLRVDGCGYAGYVVSPAYDSLIAKLIASASDYPGALRRAYRGCASFDSMAWQVTCICCRTYCNARR